MSVSRIRLVPEEYDLGSLRLYREDLVKIATEAAEAGVLKIVAGDHEATAPGDFEALPEQLANVTITAARAGSPGGVELSFTADSATVRLTEPSKETRGILVGIRQVCEPRRPRWRSRIPLSRPATFAVLLIGCMAAALVTVAIILAVTPKQGTASWASSPATAVLASAVLLAAVGYIALDRRPRIVIINAPRAERPDFWERTRDSWNVGVVTTVGGIIAGYLLGKFT